MTVIDASIGLVTVAIAGGMVLYMVDGAEHLREGHPLMALCAVPIIIVMAYVMSQIRCATRLDSGRGE